MFVLTCEDGELVIVFCKIDFFFESIHYGNAMDKNLAAFLAVARHHSLTAASDHLGLTQPSVTKRIANLEVQLGVVLFDRSQQGVELTEGGLIYLARAERIEAEYRQCHEELSVISSAGMSVLKIGAGPLFHLTCVASLFLSLKNQFPRLKLVLYTDTGPEIGEALRSGQLDAYLGIVPREQIDDAILFKKITRVEHGIVVRPDNVHAGRSHIDPADLGSFFWVLFTIDREIEDYIRKFAVPEMAGIDIRTSSFATGLQLVKDGGFVMSAPLQLAALIEREGLVIRPTPQGMPVRDSGAHVRKSSLGFSAIASLLAYFDSEDFQL